MSDSSSDSSSESSSDERRERRKGGEKENTKSGVEDEGSSPLKVTVQSSVSRVETKNRKEEESRSLTATKG